ncbi:hypothetical protein F441_19317 [Phytophthora nicotianae CJ01A1]|uniref:Uncharacterized protein n=3 Tax=Phytophthora nicotianae TaxID=4792 RepID=W2YCK2_PHYNI|nr:hypothetical protein F441_19317 [Phytophthora nicotianae CJ01A1]ETP31944.1 hypothetical protein F442_19267 [Phytophthora nicotianae P10297]
MEAPSDDGEPARVRLVQRLDVEGARVESDDDVRDVMAENGLPTATVDASGTQRHIKLDSGARFTMAGTDWMALGDRVSTQGTHRLHREN